MNFSRFHRDIILFSCVFSFFFCAACGLVDKLLGFWVFLELCGLSLIPRFFYSGGTGLYGFYSSLLTYIIMSGLSSVFLVSGIMFSSLYMFIFLGFSIKFGLFPFLFWVYRVFSESNWVFIFLFSVLMKFPVLFFCFLYNDLRVRLMYIDCGLTILVCSIFLWLLSFGWEFIWCHISLSSVSTLVVCCFCADSLVCYFIYGYYFFWGVSCILFFDNLGGEEDYNKYFWLYCFLLLITPISMPLFYKLGVSYGLIYSAFYLLFVWVIYRFSEQYFLYKCGSNYFYSGVYKEWTK